MMEVLHWSARFRRIWDNLSTSRYERSLIAERDMWKGRCERMELVLMPMTVPGARYAHEVKGPQKPPEVTTPRTGSWAAIQAEHQKELDVENEKARIRQEKN